jgi:hypothetical protein
VVVVTRKGDTAAHFEAAVGTTGIAVGIVMTLHLNQKRARAACGLRLLFDGQAVGEGPHFGKASRTDLPNGLSFVGRCRKKTIGSGRLP